MEGRPEFQPIIVQGGQGIAGPSSEHLPAEVWFQRFRQLRDWLGNSRSLEQVYQAAAKALASDKDWLEVATLRYSDTPEKEPVNRREIYSTMRFSSSDYSRLNEIARYALERRSPQVSGLAERPGLGLIAVPFTSTTSSSALIAVVHLSRASTEYLDVLYLIARHVELQSLLIRENVGERQLVFASGLLSVVRDLQSAEDIGEAMNLVTRKLSVLMHHPVAVALKSENAGGDELVELDMSTLGSRSEFNRTALLDVAHECQLRGELTEWFRSAEELPPGVLAHRQLADGLQSDTVMSVPWRSGQDSRTAAEAAGALIIVGAPDDAVVRQQLCAAATTILPVLNVIARQKVGLGGFFRQAISRTFKSSRNRVITIGVIVIALALMIRRPYQIKCECTLEPVVKRYVSAPLEAALDKVLVQPGDIVKEGQLLAELDGRDLRWELAGIEADVERARKERDSHLAVQNFAQAEAARLELTRLELTRQLLSHRLEELRIRSPFDGIVISGDLDKVRGVRLSMGDELFEVAPLDNMIVEIAIPEADISFVEQGTVLTVYIDAYPDRTWDGVLERIHPRSEVQEGANVFIGEVRFENGEGLLRPGMNGRVSITGPVRSVGWSLFHRAAEETFLWLGW